ncbi:MAG: SdrD B-like domain-containing protein, partial [Bacteroidota bacterium]
MNSRSTKCPPLSVGDQQGSILPMHLRMTSSWLFLFFCLLIPAPGWTFDVEDTPEQHFFQRTFVTLKQKTIRQLALGKHINPSMISGKIKRKQTTSLKPLTAFSSNTTQQSSSTMNAPGCNCQEYIYLNDEDLDLTHKFTVNSSNLMEVTGAGGTPWIPPGSINAPHGLAQDNNGNILLGAVAGGDPQFGPIYKYDAFGNLLDNDVIAPETEHGFNFGSANGILYILNNTENAIMAYDLCDGRFIGKMFIKNNGDGIFAWGLHLDDTNWYVANRFDGNIYQGSLDTTMYSMAGTSASSVLFNTGHTFAISALGITSDNAGNWYAIINNFDANADPVTIKKYAPDGTVLQTITRNQPSGQINNVNNGEAGWWGARGLTYSPTQDKIYVSSLENCVTIFDTDLNEIVAENIGNPQNGRAKGIDIVVECCPASTPVTIDTTICGGVGTQIFLQDLLCTDGPVAEGTWAASSIAGLRYDNCNNSVIIDSLGACGTFTLNADGTANNNQCGAFNLTINIKVGELSLSVNQTSCTESNGVFTANYDAVVNWSDGCAIGEMITVQHNGMTIGTIDPATETSPSTFNFSIAADGSKTVQKVKAAFGIIGCSDSLSFATPLPCAPNVTKDCTSGVGGEVFEDYNYNGTKDAGETQGVAGIKVYIYDCSSDNPVDSTFTDSDGEYQFPNSTAVSETDYRVEFSMPEAISCWAQPTQSGTNNGTTVQFITAPGCAELGVANPQDYCDTNPLYFVPCYVPGSLISGPYGNEPMGAAAPFNTDDDSRSALSLMPPSDLTGATWGVAHHPTSSSIFVASYLKQTSSFGPNDNGGTTTGGIYRIIDDGAGNPIVSLFADLSPLGTGTDPHPTETDVCTSTIFGTNNNACWRHDINAFGKQGKLSLGDLDLSPDGQSLFTVNLNERTLIQIPIDATSGTPTAGTPAEFDLSSLFNTCSDQSDWRPFGLGKKRGKMYLGAVCSAESTQSTDDLRGLIYEFDPNNPTSFQLIFDFDLDYEREGIIRSCNSACKTYWQPWTNVESEMTFNLRTSGSGNKKADGIEPMPMLSDIEFYGDDLIIGLRDRAADMLGDDGGSPFDYNSDRLYGQVSSGDVLRAAMNPDGSYTLENNGVTGIYTSAENYTTGAGDGTLNSGPGGKEFYSEGFSTHAELPLGGLAQMRGSDILLISSMNPHPPTFSSAGVAGFNNTNGTRVTGNIYFGKAQDYDFGKVNGLGDIELMCAPAPIEIGNLVWNDEDEDGIQDACEKGIPNVSVILYDSLCNEIATTQTDANGNYYFSDRNANDPNLNWTSTTVDSLHANTKYFVVFGGNSWNQADASMTIGGETYELTTTDAGNNNLIDSDASIGTANCHQNLPHIMVTTGNYGTVDHSNDMGLVPSTKVSLGNLVWEDLNNNGTVDAGEPGIENVELVLFSVGPDGVKDGGDDLEIARDTTDTNGNYLFEDLDDGTYYVKINSGIPTNMTSSTGTGADGTGNSDFEPGAMTNNDVNDNDDGTQMGSMIMSDTVQLAVNTEPINDGDTDSLTNLTVDFGLIRYLSVGNLVWEDANNDGLNNNGETGINAITVYLLDDGADDIKGNTDDVILDSVVTAGGGLYRFDSLYPGEYYVKLNSGIPMGMISSTAKENSSLDTEPAADPDDNVNDDDNGTQMGTMVMSELVAL